MINFAGLGDAGVGDVTGDGDADGVGALLGVVIAEAVAVGEFEACWLGWVQPATTKTNPATQAEGTKPLLTNT